MRENLEKSFPTKRLRYLTRRNISDEQHQIAVNATQATFLPMESIGEQGELNCSLVREISDIGSGYNRFFDGDVLVAKITPCFENGKGALVHGTLNGIGFGTTELHVLRPTEEINARFLYYSTASTAFRSLGEAAMFGSAGQKRVPEAFVRNYRVWLPPLSQQRAIADYLDRETARLDSLVAAKERVLKLLAEKRQAIIMQAVTRGFDPDISAPADKKRHVPDECAEDYHTVVSKGGEASASKRLRHIFSVTSGATPASANDEYWGGDILWITPEDLSGRKNYWLEDTRRKITDAGCESAGTSVAPVHSIVLSKRAPIGHLAVLGEPASCNQGCFLLVPRTELDSRYFFYWLSCQKERLQSLGRGSTFMELRVDDLKSIMVPDMPVPQQRAIADHLDRETARLDALGAKIEDTMTLLKERRAALIASAVTGRIDVEHAT